MRDAHRQFVDQDDPRRADERGSLTQEQAGEAVWRALQALPGEQTNQHHRLWIDAVEGFYNLYVKPLIEAERH